jgi:hypothetical protein
MRWGGAESSSWTICSSVPECTDSQPRVVCTNLITVTLRASSVLLVGYRAFSILQYVLTILPQNLEMAEVWQWGEINKFVICLWNEICHNISRPSDPFGGGIPIVETLWKCRLQILCFLVRASSYIPVSRPTDATCDRFLFSICMYITLHVSNVKRSSSGVPHRTYSLQFYKVFQFCTLPRVW